MHLGLVPKEDDQAAKPQQFFQLRERPGATKLVIAFSSVSVEPPKFSLYNTLLDSPFHVLFVNDAENRWYQSGVPGLGDSAEATAEAMQNIADKLGVSDIVTVGASMGGYGALLLGSYLNCTVFAFDPETIIKLPRSRSTKNMPKDAPVYYRNLRDRLAHSKAAIMICSGELDIIDMISASNVRDLPNVRLVTIRGVEHKTPQFIDSKIGFRQFLLDSISLGALQKVPCQGDICSAPGALEGLIAVEKELEAKNYQQATALLEPLCSAHPATDVFWYKLGLAKAHLGDHVGAAAAHREAILTAPHNFRAHHQLSISLHVMRDIHGACVAATMSATFDPTFAAPHYRRGLALSDLGRYEEAEASFSKAVELEPTHTVYRSGLMKALTDGIKRREQMLAELRSENAPIR